MNGIVYKSERKATIGGESCIINQLKYATSTSSCKLELKPNKATKTKFYTNWMILPIQDYMEITDLEAKEIYDYDAHITTNAMLPKITFSTEDSSGNKEPVINTNTQDKVSISFTIYTRNYEEWVGIHKEPGGKFYEDYFIKLYAGSGVETVFKDYKRRIEKSYTDYYTETESKVLDEIEKIVNEYAAKLWNAAVKQHQLPSVYIAAGAKVHGIEKIHDANQKLDDRPLYWARNKMQYTSNVTLYLKMI